MKKEIINERKKRDAIQPVIGFSIALIMITLLGIFDVRKYGVEIEAGTETTIFWIVRFLCIVLIPLFVFLLVKFVKQLFNNELFFKVSNTSLNSKIYFLLTLIVLFGLTIISYFISNNLYFLLITIILLSLSFLLAKGINIAG